ncbi:MAG: hypothetical protein WAM17_14250, partial [Rhodoplanes sp.]
MPYTREKRIVQGRKRHVTVPLFSNYGFAVVVLQWSGIRYCPGVGALIMDGLRPARVPDHVIEELQKRERNGVIDLPAAPPRLRPGARVKVVGGPFRGHLGLCASMTAHERVIVLLSLLGSQQRVSIPAGDVEAIEGRKSEPGIRPFASSRNCLPHSPTCRTGQSPLPTSLFCPMPMSKGSRTNSTLAPERYSATKPLARFSSAPEIC